MALEEPPLTICGAGKVARFALGASKPGEILVAQAGGADGVDLHHAETRDGIGCRRTRSQWAE